MIACTFLHRLHASYTNALSGNTFCSFCFDAKKKVLNLTSKDDSLLNNNIFQICMKDVKSRTTKTGAWREDNYLDNVELITEKKSFFSESYIYQIKRR